MDTHVRVLSWLWIIIGVLGMLGAFCLGATIEGSGLISEDETAILVKSIVALFCGSLFFLEKVLNIIAGVGLLKVRSWGRILVIILGIINLFGFPIGTILAIYTLWVMFNVETRQLFEREYVRSEVAEEYPELAE